MLNVEISEAVFVHLHIIFDKDVLLWGTEKKKSYYCDKFRTQTVARREVETRKGGEVFPCVFL